MDIYLYIKPLTIWQVCLCLYKLFSWSCERFFLWCILCLLLLVWACLNLISGSGNPFQNIEKTTVLQETRIFNDCPVDSRKCTHILTKILYLLNQVRCRRLGILTEVTVSSNVSLLCQWAVVLWHAVYCNEVLWNCQFFSVM